jgi:hypothetical protein
VRSEPQRENGGITLRAGRYPPGARRERDVGEGVGAGGRAQRLLDVYAGHGAATLSPVRKASWIELSTRRPMRWREHLFIEITKCAT